MKLNYLKCSPYHLGGWQYNTGDGIKMAMKAGGGPVAHEHDVRTVLALDSNLQHRLGTTPRE